MIVSFWIDDSTHAVQKQLDLYTPGGIGPIAEMVFMGQRVDIGVGCVTHTLSGTSQIIKDNCQTVIVLGLPGENPRLISDTLAIPIEAAERVKKLLAGEFAFLNPALWDKCVYATFETPLIPGKVTESERRRAVVRFLAKVGTFPLARSDVFGPKPSVNAGENGIHSVQQKLASSDIEMLICAATGSRRPIGVIYSLMGLSRTQGRRIAKRLESLGALVLHPIPTGKRGGRMSFPEVTDFGWQVLNSRGILRPPCKTNGTFLHELAACLIEAWERKRSWVVTFEVDLGGKRGDAMSRNKDTGAKRIWQIGVSDPVREANSIEAIMRLPVMQTSEFIFVARDRKFLGRVKELLEQKGPSGQLLNRVVGKTIAEFVENVKTVGLLTIAGYQECSNARKTRRTGS